MATKKRARTSRTPARKKPRASKRVQPKAKTAKAKPRAAARPTAAPARRPPAAPATNPVRQLAQRLVALTINHQDEQALAYYADNVESREPGMPPMTGMDAIRQKFVQWRSMVSDATWTARSVAVEGNTIVIEWSGRVTFADGRQVDFDEIAVHEVENGKIVRERFYYDPSIMRG